VTLRTHATLYGCTFHPTPVQQDVPPQRQARATTFPSSTVCSFEAYLPGQEGRGKERNLGPHWTPILFLFDWKQKIYANGRGRLAWGRYLFATAAAVPLHFGWFSGPRRTQTTTGTNHSRTPTCGEIVGTGRCRYHLGHTTCWLTQPLEQKG